MIYPYHGNDEDNGSEMKVGRLGCHFEDHNKIQQRIKTISIGSYPNELAKFGFCVAQAIL
jgi:hypothetical protein